MFKIKKIAGVLTAVAVTSAVTASSAFAAIDVTELTNAGTDVATVGGAALGVLMAAAAFKYVRRAL